MSAGRNKNNKTRLRKKQRAKARREYKERRALARLNRKVKKQKRLWLLEKNR